MKKSLPRVFIGSSSEGLDVAKNIQILLDYVCESTLWTQGVFGLGEGTLESLVASLDKFDFAILVLTPDDLITSRDATSQSPRDNVLFELGLFMGRIGRTRTFIVYDRNSNLKLPSDLAGITKADYGLHSDGNLQSSLGAATTKIGDQINRLGIFSTSQNVHDQLCQADWKVTQRQANKIGVDIKAMDASNLFFILLSVLDCERSRIAIEDLQAKQFNQVIIEASYDLMGSWDLLIKFRSDNSVIANNFYENVVETLISKTMMDNSADSSFGRKKLINVMAQSKTINTLVDQNIQDEQISYTLLPSNSDYDMYRANRSFIFIEAQGDRNTQQRKVFLNHLKNSIENGVGKKIIESICEGEKELVIETLSTCSQSNFINHLNREIEKVLTTHGLQKYTLSCYYHEENGLLKNSKTARDSLI